MSLLELSQIGVLTGTGFLLLIIFMLLWENMKLRKDRHELIIPEGKEVILTVRKARDGYKDDKDKAASKDSAAPEDEPKSGVS